jgi:hypothetical protein
LLHWGPREDVRTEEGPGGPPVDKYAYGFADQRIDGVRIVGHNGGTPGYEGQLDIYPDLGCVVVILANQDQALVPAIQHSEDLVTRETRAPRPSSRRSLSRHAHNPGPRTAPAPLRPRPSPRGASHPGPNHCRNPGYA